MLDLPSMRATRSSGSSTHSSVRPRQNSPGWMTKDSSALMATSSVRPAGGSRRSIAEARWLWNTRNESPRRRSTLAGWTRPGSHGSILMRPVSTSSRIVASDRTEASALIWFQVCQRRGTGAAAVPRVVLPLDRAGPRAGRAHPRRRGRRRIAVRPTAGVARERLAGVRGVALDPAVVVARGRLVGLLLDRPPDDVDQSGQRDLQGEHQPDESPSHGVRSYRDRAGISPRRGGGRLSADRLGLGGGEPLLQRNLRTLPIEAFGRDGGRARMPHMRALPWSGRRAPSGRLCMLREVRAGPYVPRKHRRREARPRPSVPGKRRLREARAGRPCPEAPGKHSGWSGTAARGGAIQT